MPAKAVCWTKWKIVLSVFWIVVGSIPAYAQEQWFGPTGIDAFRVRRFVSLVFASQDLKTPVSLFGHTFLVFHDQAVPESDDPVIEFLGETIGIDNFAFKALFSSIPGRFHGIRWIYKAREYELENRDLWIFTLHLNTDERAEVEKQIEQALVHPRRYSFFSDNCAFHIYKLIDVLHPKDSTASLFYTIPIDTIQELAREQKISTVHYLPSGYTRSMQALQKLRADDQQRIAMILDGYNLSIETNNDNQYFALAVAESSRYRLAREADPGLRQQFFLMQKKLSPIGFSPPPTTNPIDDMRSMRLGIQLTQPNERLNIIASPFLQDIEHPINGMVGSKLEIFTLDIGLQDERLDIDRFTLLRMQALKPVDIFTPAFSRFLEVSFLRKPPFTEKNQVGALVLRWGGGIAYAPNTNSILGLIPFVGLHMKVHEKQWIGGDLGMKFYAEYHLSPYLRMQMEWLQSALSENHFWSQSELQLVYAWNQLSALTLGWNNIGRYRQESGIRLGYSLAI